MFRKVTTILASVFLVLFIAGCSVTPDGFKVQPVTEQGGSTNVQDSETTLALLNDADVIQLKKAPIAISDEWLVSVGDTENSVDVGVIKGEFFKPIGDVYRMYSLDGNLIGVEDENFRIINATANLYDLNMEPAGSIEQQVFSLLYKFTLKDSEGIAVGLLEQNFSLNLTGDIKVPEGETAWTIDKAFLNVGAKITVTRGVDSNISAVDAVWLTVIMNEIAEAQEEKNNNN